MADQIKVLPEKLANMIAAGEVIERPASVVKELVENAIDAGGERISVEIKSGGKQLIRVMDDGGGMAREDAVLAFERHATSKIAGEDDLYRIGTFGFRGEALASIASVARVDLTTNTQGEAAGTRVRIDGGSAPKVTDAGRAAGTTVAVSQLFYNVPARRKFLRTTGTETRHVVSVVSSIAMAYPGTAFTLTVDGRDTLSLPAVSNTYTRAQAVMGNTLMNQMIPVTFDDDLVKIHGFISRPDAARVSRTHQHLYINLRPVSSRALNRAVFEGYGSILPRERFPVSVVFLNIDLDQVDVNVHPAKREIRFSDESKVYERLLRAIRLALQNSDVVPVFDTDTPDISGLSPAAAPGEVRAPVDVRVPVDEPAVARRTQIDLFGPVRGNDGDPTGEWTYTPADSERGARDEGVPGTVREHGDAEMVSLWQLHNAYILAQVKGGFMLIDQHAAHERVLFERALKTMGHESAPSRQLLFPVTLDLMVPQIALVREQFDHFARLGFNVKLFGEQTVVVDAVPCMAHSQDVDTLFHRMIENLQEMPEKNLKNEERIAMTFSGHAGIRKGDPLSQQEMNGLVNDLFATEMPYVTPRGRPTVVRMPLEEIERRFNRSS
ncbi:MAG: DNA mismatch repair endonuclease MutL [Gemmatimonadetes bacterium]|nr:DNA mismatch repair endonuclease MutL [Gemmatimonadota bacterium]MYG85638.1 DNA mismatch repair endonuclease MutL [Gemmatimonadota bacterium]MYJ91403.1 DNA mismatch repair endonuclease MutL [Gemmatimonadota bacterium]